MSKVNVILTDMGLCGKVDDGVDLTLVDDERDEIGDSDVTLDESVVRVTRDICVVVGRSAVIELVEIDHVVLRKLEHHLTHKVRATCVI